MVVSGNTLSARPRSSWLFDVSCEHDVVASGSVKNLVVLLLDGTVPISRAMVGLGVHGGTCLPKNEGLWEDRRCQYHKDTPSHNFHEVRLSASR